jgi:hypothetical protein
MVGLEFRATVYVNVPDCRKGVIETPEKDADSKLDTAGAPATALGAAHRIAAIAAMAAIT